MRAATLALPQDTRAGLRARTVLDDMSGWTQGALASPVPVSPVPGAVVRGLRATANSKVMARRYTTPLDLSGANMVLNLRTSDPRSDGGTWQSLWRIDVSSNGTLNGSGQPVVGTQRAYLLIKAAPGDFPLNKPDLWQPFEIPCVSTYGGSGRWNLPAGATAPNWSSINYVSMTAAGKSRNGAGDPGTFEAFLGGIERIERAPSPVVTIYWDRITPENLTYGIPVYAEFGVQITMRGDSSQWDTGNGVAAANGAQVRDAQNTYGHRVGIYGHRINTGFEDGANNFGGNPKTAYPVFWSLMPQAEAEQVTTDAKAMLLRHGVASQWDMHSGQQRKLTGDAYLSMLAGQYRYSDQPGNEDYPAMWPPLEPMHCPTLMYTRVHHQPTGSELVGAEMMDTLDRLEAENGWLRLLFHVNDADGTADGWAIGQQELRQLLNEIINVRGIPVRSHDDVMAGRV